MDVGRRVEPPWEKPEGQRRMAVERVGVRREIELGQSMEGGGAAAATTTPMVVVVVAVATTTTTATGGSRTASAHAWAARTGLPAETADGPLRHRKGRWRLVSSPSEGAAPDFFVTDLYARTYIYKCAMKRRGRRRAATGGV
jgi:hypothetical protein